MICRDYEYLFQNDFTTVLFSDIILCTMTLQKSKCINIVYVLTVLSSLSLSLSDKLVKKRKSSVYRFTRYPRLSLIYGFFLRVIHRCICEFLYCFGKPNPDRNIRNIFVNLRYRYGTFPNILSAN